MFVFDQVYQGRIDREDSAQIRGGSLLLGPLRGKRRTNHRELRLQVLNLIAPFIQPPLVTCELRSGRHPVGQHGQFAGRRFKLAIYRRGLRILGQIAPHRPEQCLPIGHRAFPRQHFVVNRFGQRVGRPACRQENAKSIPHVVHHQQLLVFRLDCGGLLELLPHDIGGQLSMAGGRGIRTQSDFATRQIVQANGVAGMFLAPNLLVDGERLDEEWFRLRVVSFGQVRHGQIVQAVGVIGMFFPQNLLAEVERSM